MRIIFYGTEPSWNVYIGQSREAGLSRENQECQRSVSDARHSFLLLDMHQDTDNKHSLLETLHRMTTTLCLNVSYREPEPR